MAKKLGRKAAGAQVATLVQAFSDDLLVDEKEAFARTSATFVVGLSEARRTLRLGDEEWVTKVVRSHLAAAARSVDIATQLGRVAISKGLESVGKELQVCEQTLSTRYRGVAELAVQGATDAGVEILAQATTAYQNDASAAALEFESRARLQLSQSTDVVEAKLRLFSPEPAGLRGFGGRGVWWWTVSDLHETLRAVATRSSNLARLSAMQTFNRLAEDR